MDIYNLIKSRRTVRRFKQNPIDRKILENLVDAARFAPSGGNLQPVKYAITDDREIVSAVFDNVKWAAYLAPEGTPAENERPVAFIAVLADTSIKKSGWELDTGAACQNIFLMAASYGIGTCWMGAINREAIKKIMNIPEKYILNTVIALGYSAENPVAEDLEDESGSIRYYKDEKNVLHVPKRKLKDVLVAFNRF